MQVHIEVLEPDQRPVSVSADFQEVRNMKSLTLHHDPTRYATVLFDPDHSLEERLMKEQFAF
jgi:NAD+ kinase